MGSSISESETATAAGTKTEEVDGLLHTAIDIDQELLAGIELVRLSSVTNPKMTGILEELAQKVIRNAELLRQARLRLRR